MKIQKKRGAVFVLRWIITSEEEKDRLEGGKPRAMKHHDKMTALFSWLAPIYRLAQNHGHDDDGSVQYLNMIKILLRYLS